MLPVQLAEALNVAPLLILPSFLWVYLQIAQAQRSVEHLHSCLGRALGEVIRSDGDLVSYNGENAADWRRGPFKSHIMGSGLLRTQLLI